MWPTIALRNVWRKYAVDSCSLAHGACFVRSAARQLFETSTWSAPRWRWYCAVAATAAAVASKSRWKWVPLHDAPLTDGCSAALA